MEKLKIWLKKNWSTVLLGGIFIIILVNPDAKAWVMRQIISTGLLNSKIEKENVENSSIVTAASIAESFTVKDKSGKIIDVSELRGKVVFINFWASWCPPCRAEFPSIEKFHEKYKHNSNIFFLTINMDEDLEEGKAYFEKEKYTIPFLIPNGNIPNEYFGGSLPTTIILDKKGKIRMKHEGMADYSKNSFYEEIDQLLKE
ncbi:TlpA family protein disulfide reductase [Chryseobacterium sp. Ch-15]|uniref:TlpA family protein disulfide reductase n=1 Tax=Chryseobacterium muglaense TaxID=2893752 RepID=A0A9Q3UYZ8_9FLAO|nr:TlpA disulfide reductase family protein [Chryseobacterium muglaense]MBD3906725.1 TlpA family protein disulfide reductase [Chryseobacterium muglaense]MCC9036611.1 TlpA family protein disulfide reductase [Chryseobacterium muglaense]MCM2556481.1 TlpA family protein disulfide reductase [Chryseobacterium muglaense]